MKRNEPRFWKDIMLPQLLLTLGAFMVAVLIAIALGSIGYAAMLILKGIQ